MGTYFDPIINFLNTQLGSAMAGGAIGGLLTFFGVKKTIDYEKSKVKHIEDEEVKTFCQAIQTELETILARYNKTVGEKIKNHDPSQPFTYYYYATQAYFTVFDSNAQMIGKIKDKALRSKIVEAYIYAKSIIDSFKLNNETVTQYQEFHIRASNTRDKYDNEKRDNYLFILKQNTPELKNLNTAVNDKIMAVLEALKKYQ